MIYLSGLRYVVCILLLINYYLLLFMLYYLIINYLLYLHMCVYASVDGRMRE